MKTLNRQEPFILLFGDMVIFLTSLLLALYLRTFEVPSWRLFLTHLKPFSFLFLIWVVVFYIAGLYDKHTILLRTRLPARIANTLLANAAIAIAFFYLVPFFGITPKTILFIYLLVSFVLIASWRIYGYFAFSSRKPEKALLIGSGGEMQELYKEVNGNPLYNIHFIAAVDLSEVDQDGFWDTVISLVNEESVSIIAIDLMHARVSPALPHLYRLIFSGVTFIDMHRVYEDVFNRVPLSLLRYNWFLENVSTTPRGAYDTLKRGMDLALAIVLLVVSIPFCIVAYIMITLDDHGPVIIAQERIGQNNKLIRIHKFRTMTGNDDGEYESGGTKLVVTKAGAFLRKSRIDELPQIWSVLTGDQSLIGPRPELPTLVKLYEKEIPYYSVRSTIKPGLSGWAQIYQENHPHHGEAVMETKEKLAYDLYYIKNRSLLLDLKIALKTVKTLLSRVGK